MTTLVTAVPEVPIPPDLSESATRALTILRWAERPMSVLELAARLACPPVVAATITSELVRPLITNPHLGRRPADTATRLSAPRLARQVFAPSTRPASRLRTWTAPAPDPATARMHHDLWLFVSADDRARLTLGAISPLGATRLPTPHPGGELLYGAALDEHVYTSLIGVCGLEETTSDWEWLTRTAAGAVVLADSSDLASVGAQARAVAAHHVPCVVLATSEKANDQQVREAVGLDPATPVVYGSAAARYDIDEAVRRLEERG